MIEFSLITHALPSTITVGGSEYNIDTRTCVALQAFAIMEAQEIPLSLRMSEIISRILSRNIAPENISEAYDQICEFLSGWDGSKKKRSSARILSFTQDHYLIIAAFRQAYGVSLAEIKSMHWWEFMALLNGLPEDTALSKVMSIRSMEIDPKASPDLKAKQRKAKAQVAIRQKIPEGMTGEDIVSAGLSME